jgi:TonB family protein
VWWRRAGNFIPRELIREAANLLGWPVSGILEAVVDKEGRVADVRVLRSAHRLLDDGAIEAVRQWQYVPLVLNGIPERFILTVVLTFNLTQQAAGDQGGSSWPRPGWQRCKVGSLHGSTDENESMLVGEQRVTARLERSFTATACTSLSTARCAANPAGIGGTLPSRRAGV